MTQDVRTSNDTFANLPEGAQGHFLLHFYAVIARILAHLQMGGVDEKNIEHFPFLLGYQALLAEWIHGAPSTTAPDAWWETHIAHWEAETSEAADHLPLQAIREEAGLCLSDIFLLIAVGLVEEDIRFGSLFAALQAPLTVRRPCLGILGWLMSVPGHSPTDIWDACRSLLDYGLLHVENSTDPRAEWILRIPAPIWDALRGKPGTQPAPGLTLQRAATFPGLDELILPATLQERILQLPQLLLSRQVKTLIMRGMSGSGRRTTLGAVARTQGRHVLLWEGGKPDDENWRMIGPLATLMKALPLLRFDLAPSETLDLPGLLGYNGPVGMTLGRSGGLRGPLLEHSLSFALPAPDEAARRRFWQTTHVPLQSAVLEEIVAHFLLTGGHIHTAATLARTYAMLDKRTNIRAADVQQATRTLNRQALETLATAMQPTNGWSDLVLSTTTADELHALEARCRMREKLRQQVGPALKQSLNRGVRALFSGPSGTGKTLAARALADVLEMDLYRVDLAAVVNKYIGETERNLNQVFARAEELDVVLLLDEGDALMTNRTDVRSSNDRYANLETNYLLQRLETYEGIVIITTNAGNRIDAAFLRRIDAIIDFAQPEATERWMIWQSHLPLAHMVSPMFLQEVAVRCVLTGGQIRNAALHATLLSASHDGQIQDTHLEKAIQREYRKAGAACPLRAR